MRRLHRADRRRSDAILHHKSRRRRRPADYDHRRAGAQRAAASPAGSLPRSGLDAVWVLHSGNDPVRSGSAARQRKAHAPGNRSRDAGQRMPLRHVSANSTGGGDGRKASEGGAEMIPIEPERYELQAGPAYNFELNRDFNRRDIFKLLGSGIVVLSMVGEARG